MVFPLEALIMNPVDFTHAKTLRRACEPILDLLRRYILQENPSPHEASVIVERLRQLSEATRLPPLATQSGAVAESERQSESEAA